MKIIGTCIPGFPDPIKSGFVIDLLHIKCIKPAVHDPDVYPAGLTIQARAI